jgi:hypothetical protein
MDQHGQQGNYGQQQQAPPPYPPQGDYGQQQPPPPYQPQGGYPPPGYPPQQPPRRKSWPRRHKVLTALLAVVGLIIIISVASAAGGGGGNSGSSSTGSTTTGTTSGGSGQQAAPPAAAGPHIGQAAADGKFSFTVTGVGHAHQVGDQYLNATAQGRYVVLDVTVKNIGTEAQTLDDSAQYVYDSSGRKFSVDSSADIYGNGGNSGVFLDSINPGNSITGRLYFDLPKGDHAVKAELHDSVFSGGVTVSLTH